MNDNELLSFTLSFLTTCLYYSTNPQWYIWIHVHKVYNNSSKEYKISGYDTYIKMKCY